MYRIEQAIKKFGYDPRIMELTLKKGWGDRRAAGRSIAEKYGFTAQCNQ